jgi:hypothetical protein
VEGAVLDQLSQTFFPNQGDPDFIAASGVDSAVDGIFDKIVLCMPSTLYGSVAGTAVSGTPVMSDVFLDIFFLLALCLTLLARSHDRPMLSPIHGSLFLLMDIAHLSLPKCMSWVII